jgi:hypothetical protein
MSLSIAIAGDFIPGDVNDDGFFDVLDATVLRRALADLGPGMTQGCISELPATGQTRAYHADKNDGVPGPVSVADDGTIRAGAALNYVDNGDGTITDLNTGLMWEKKSNDGGLHHKDDLYYWSGNGAQETICDWLDDVNAEGGPGFANYSDWRIPNVKELKSIIDYEQYGPPVDAVFNDCSPGCTIPSCSCTASSSYWSATSHANNPGVAWYVRFSDGHVFPTDEGLSLHVRAVRGGL